MFEGIYVLISEMDSVAKYILCDMSNLICELVASWESCDDNTIICDSGELSPYSVYE